jgi:hypothetical protein
MVGMDEGSLRSRWFATAEWRDGGLWLPGRPTRHTADLLLRPDGVELRRGDATCTLSWAGRVRGDWTIRHHLSGRNYAWRKGGVRGTALVLWAAPDDGAAAVRARTRSWRHPLRGLLEPGSVIPLHSQWLPAETDTAERDSLAALCKVLADDEAARSRLADPGTVAALVRDLAAGARLNRRERTGVRRTTFEILTALRGLGYRHAIGGRPVPGGTADLDTVMADVRRALGANRYVAGLHLSEDRIRAEVLREFIDVEPWPFAALTAPPAASPTPLEGVTEGPATGGRAG